MIFHRRPAKCPLLGHILQQSGIEHKIHLSIRTDRKISDKRKAKLTDPWLT